MYNVNSQIRYKLIKWKHDDSIRFLLLFAAVSVYNACD